MKKTLSILALAAAATLTLSACHPPNEQPTDEKIDTATGVAAPTAKVTSSAEVQADLQQVGDPGYVDCGDSTETLPSTIHVSCHDGGAVVKNITWDTIGEKKAIGTGTLVDDDTTTEDVPVVLSEPEMTSNGYVFTTATVNGEEVSVH